jgi:hypothetical protein
MAEMWEMLPATWSSLTHVLLKEPGMGLNLEMGRQGGEKERREGRRTFRED